jgi:alkanesulfonate monooxygenase SsuD/methylene tetrahydromethanopterin reductase-like flavin-dependent oxidoreductase (luciferase family)
MDDTATLLPRRNDDIAAAAAKTSTICLGTSVVPIYLRHPPVLAQQTLSLHDLAPDRLRLGIGPSHRFIIEDAYDLHHKTSLAHLQVYLNVLREVLWEGKVDHHGHVYNVVATLPQASHIPVLISTLGEKAFQLAGQVADGALFMVMACPVFDSHWNSGTARIRGCSRTSGFVSIFMAIANSTNYCIV